MRILVAGDYCPIGRAGEAIERSDFASIFGGVKETIENVDYSIVNLECPIVEKMAKPIEKCGPNLCCSSKGIEALKWAGFHCVTLANNHFLDYGESGVKDTLSVCETFNIDYVGGGLNINEASRILYKDLGGKRLAIINCCEHEFSIASFDDSGSNPLNVVKQYYAIKEAREKADHVLVIVHGGIELFWLPSERMIEMYRFFIDAGADAVINHHQHCYSGYEIHNGKPIFYGLGNFCFDGILGGDKWTSGCMVELNLSDKNSVDFELIPYFQYRQNEGVYLMEGKDKESFFSTVMTYNDVIADSRKCKEEYTKWCDENENMYSIALNPAYGRYTSFLFKGVIGRKIINKHKLLKQYDYLVNESHIERLIMALRKKIEVKG